MILAVDVGNTNIVLGVLDGKEIVKTGRISTDLYSTDDEYAMKIMAFLTLNKIDNIDGAIISSVVPGIVRNIKKAVKIVCGADSIVVGPGIKTGIRINIDDPASVGADLIVAAVAAKEKYPIPSITFDLGTATTAMVVDKNGDYIGGAIAPGVKTGINSLSSATAQLPQIDISAPKSPIGRNTIDAMKSGSVLGTAAMIDGLIDRIETELGEKATIIITGGLGKSISKNCIHDMIYDENLLIDGLALLYEKNK